MRLTAPSLRSWAAFGLFLVLFSAAYLPALRTEYCVEDGCLDLVSEALDPPEYAIDRESDRALTPGRAWRRNVAEGRPLYGLAKHVTYRMVSGMEDYPYVRFLSILGIALLAWSLYRVLVRAGHDRIQCFCVAAIACTALPFQAWAHWAVLAILPFSAALAGFAFLLADRAASAASSPGKWWRAGGAGLALLTSFAMYQLGAMFYWVFAAVVLLDPKRTTRDLFRRLRWHCAIAAAAMASSYGLAVIGLTLYPMHDDRTVLASNLPGQLKWFLLHAFHYAPNFALPSPSSLLLPDTASAASIAVADRIVGWAFFLVVSWGLVRHLRAEGGEARWKYGAAVFLLAASFLPVLPFETHDVRYRMLGAASTLLVLYAYFALKGFAGAFRRHSRLHSRLESHLLSLPGRVVGIAAIAAVLSAAYHFRVFLVEPQVREMEFLRRELTRNDLSGVRRLYLVQPTPETTLAPLRRLEFGRPSSMMEGSSLAMVFLALRETAPAHADLPVIRIRYDEPVTPLPDSLVVDLRDLGSPP